MNVDPLVAALTPPEITLDGRRYVGRLLSYEQWYVYQPLFQQMLKGELTDAQTLALIKTYLHRGVFPWRVRYLWQGHPARKIRALPFAVQQQVIADFLGCQVAATTGHPSSATPSPAPAVAGVSPTA